MRIDRLDHLVLTVADLDATVDFHTRVLGMREIRFAEGRRALAGATGTITGVYPDLIEFANRP